MENLTPVTRVEHFLQEIIEQGGGGGGGTGGGIVFVAEDATGVLNKTWNDIRTAMNTSIVIITSTNAEDITNPMSHALVSFAGEYLGEFKLWDTTTGSYTATSADGYPVNDSHPVPVGN